MLLSTSSYLTHVPLSLLPGMDGVHALSGHHSSRHRTALWSHHSGSHSHYAGGGHIPHEAIGHCHPNHHTWVGPHHGRPALSHHGAHDCCRRHGRAHARESLITSRGLDRELHLRGAHEHASCGEKETEERALNLHM